MNFLHRTFLFLGLMMISSGNAMERKTFEKGSYVRVVRGPEAMRGKIMKIQGTSMDIWGIDDVDGSVKSFGIGALKKYLLTDHPDNGGTVYYAKSVTSPIKDCIHESWIEPENKFNEDDEIVEWSFVSLPGGELVQKGVTRGESREKFEQWVQSHPNDFTSFKKEYINNYYPDVDLHKASLVAHAPNDLKQWFSAIKEGKKPEALLVYGAYGVGKTMTVEALTQDAGAQLCHFYSHAVMRWDYGVNQFKFDYLEQLGQDPTCILVDNIEKLADDDVENMKKLADHCAAKKNIHLLAIAYHAKKNMPSELYAKFRALKFPMPDEKKKLALMKDALKEKKVKDDVDDIYLDNYLSRVPGCSVRTIGDLHSFAQDAFHDHNEESKTVELSKDNFEAALKELKDRRNQLKMIFNECE